MNNIGKAYDELKTVLYNYESRLDAIRTHINVNSGSIKYVIIYGIINVHLRNGKILRFGKIGWSSMGHVVEYHEYHKHVNKIGHNIDELWEIYNILINYDIEQLFVS